MFIFFVFFSETVKGDLKVVILVIWLLVEYFNLVYLINEPNYWGSPEIIIKHLFLFGSNVLLSSLVFWKRDNIK